MSEEVVLRSRNSQGGWPRFRLPVVWLMFMWMLEITDALFFRGTLDGYGIRPREWVGIRGILIAPFLHGGFGHLLANSLPFLLFGWLVALRGVGVFVAVSLTTMLLGGGLVWLLAPSGSIHIGASGLVFGLFGFTLARGFFERRFFPLLLSLLVGFAYGGLLWGVLPGIPGVSWQSHLFGLLAGFAAARRVGPV